MAIESNLQSLSFDRQYDSRMKYLHHFPINDELNMQAKFHGCLQAHRCDMEYPVYCHYVSQPLVRIGVRPYRVSTEIRIDPHSILMDLLIDKWSQAIVHCESQIADKSVQVQPKVFWHKQYKTNQYGLYG